ncbi:MAG: hypothetical protein QM666_07560 [Acinetobacter sp.]
MMYDGHFSDQSYAYQPSHQATIVVSHNPPPTPSLLQQINAEAASLAQSVGFNVDKFIEKLESVRSTRSHARCARSIRIALESAGANVQDHPIAASDWGNTLKKIGYKQINPAFDQPQVGDIYIIHRTRNHIYGHIAGYTGSEWVSDFKQSSYDVYNNDNVTYSYYRLEQSS